MWTEIQAGATILAFIAAAWYAWIARRQARIYGQLLAIEQTPVLIIEGFNKGVRNIGRGPAFAAFFCSVEKVITIGVVLPNSNLVAFAHDAGLGLSDDRLACTRETSSTRTHWQPSVNF